MKKTLAIFAFLMLLPIAAVAQTNEPVASDSTPAEIAEPALAETAETTLVETAETTPAETVETTPAETAEPAPAETAETVAPESEAMPIEAAIIPEAPVDTVSNEKTSGFSFLVSLGGTYAFYERLSSGFESFDAKAGGLLFDINIGYRMKYVAFYFEALFRAAFASEASMDSHCPGINFVPDDCLYCYDYESIRKGEWDHAFYGFAAIVLGIIPLNDSISLTLGGGPLLYLGYTMNKVGVHKQFALKLQIGVEFEITRNMTLGFTVSEEGWLSSYRSISPVLTFGYTLF